MTERPQRWDRVAAAVNERRKILGLHRQIDLARAAGLSDASVRPFTSGKLRNGVPPDEATRGKLCDALRWSPDSIDRLLAGEEPVEVAPAVDATQLAALDAEVKELRLAVSELQALTDPAMDWLVEVAAVVGVAMPARLRSVL